MMERSIRQTIAEQFSVCPAVLMTGAKRTGKTTLCRMLSEELGIPYVTLSDIDERQSASADPDGFIRAHGYPLIIDDVQFAPELFGTLGTIIDRECRKDPECSGLFILARCQSHITMETAQSLSEKMYYIDIPTISISEELGLLEKPFAISPESSFARCGKIPDDFDFIEKAFRGMYPEVVCNPEIDLHGFYSEYVESFIDDVVPELIDVKDRPRFRSFMEIVASMTGRILDYRLISKSTDVKQHTADKWIDILETGGIVTILRPYSDASVSKRTAEHPKIFMRDTGLACHLAHISDPTILMSSYLRDPVIGTFILNEIIKTHLNGGSDAQFFHFRDSDCNRIDLVMLNGDELSIIGCRPFMTYTVSDIGSFGKLQTSSETKGCIVCLCRKPYPITKEFYALPAKTTGC